MQEQVEEEGLVEVLQQVVDTATHGLYGLPQGHGGVPALLGPKHFERDGVDAVGNEDGVRARRVPSRLSAHSI